MPRRDLFHVAVPAEWDAARAAGSYEWSTRGRSLAEEGFVHCSYAHQVERIANLFYADLVAVVLLTLDPVRLDAPVVAEEAVPGGERFPHVYGPIPLTAVMSAMLWRRGDDGTYAREMPYDRDILDELADSRRPPTYPAVDVALGIVVEDRASGFVGDVVKWSSAAVTLRDRRGQLRHFGWKDGGFLLEGRPVTLRRPAARREASLADRLTASGSVAAERRPARAAVGSRIWVEGRHDAELLELVWGEELRDGAIVVEPLHGIDDLAAAVAEFSPSPQCRLGVLVDHLVAGSKEQRVAAAITSPHVLVTGHPFVDVWAGIRPKLLGLDAWPDVPRGVPWKEGMCRALGTDIATFWPRLRNRVTSYADLRPELVGAVERLLDFVTD